MLHGVSYFRFILVLILINLSSLVEASSLPTVADRIEDDYRSGQISLEQKILWQLASVKEPQAVPAQYQPLTSGKTAVGKSATSIFLEARKNIDLLSANGQTLASQYLARPGGIYTFDSPEGNFKLHYDISGTNAVPIADNNVNGTPDFIEKVADYCDSSWRTIVHNLGYMQPPSDGVQGGDSRYDIYFEEMPYYGYTSYESAGPNPWNDAVSWISLHRDFLYFPPNTDPEGNQWGAAKVTAAHEYFHAVQFAYDVNEDLWWMEASSTWMEDIVFDVVNDNYNYLSSFFSSPQTALTDNGFHAYSAFIWNKFLEERLDTVTVRKIWDGCIYGTIYNATNDSLQSNYGYSFDSALAEFASWNFVTNVRDDGLHYEEAEYYSAMTLAENRSAYPVALHNCSIQPQGYGSAYILLRPGSATGNLIVKFDGIDTREWAVYLIKSPTQNSHVVEKMAMNPFGWMAEDTVSNFESYYSVSLAAVNITQYSAPGSFAYSAELQAGYAVSGNFLSDTVGYSGYNHRLYLQISNIGALNDILQVEFSDSLGWIYPSLDTVFILNAGTDSTLEIDMPVPQGTPLSSRNTLLPIVRSQGDSLKIDSSRVPFVIVVYHGDADFNGALNIIDVTYLLSFLYKGGPAPQPVEDAGDATCNGIINILDVSALLAFLYKDGPQPPCNPF